MPLWLPFSSRCVQDLLPTASYVYLIEGPLPEDTSYNPYNNCTFTMPAQQFYLLGEPISSAKHIEVDTTLDLDGLKDLIAAHFAIVEPDGKLNGPN